jgi:hypothetical protein
MEWSYIHELYNMVQSKCVAILNPIVIEFNINETNIDENGRYILLDGTFNGHTLCLFNIYHQQQIKQMNMPPFYIQKKH